MKILFLTRRFYPEVGGVEKHVEEVSRLLVRDGHQVLVLCEEPEKKSLASMTNYHSRSSSDSIYINLKQPVKSIQSVTFEAKKIAIVRLKLGKNDWFKKFRIWAQVLKNSSLFMSADIIHCHDVFFWYIPLRFLLPHKKVYITFHGYETKFPPTIRAKLIRKFSESASRGNICVGKYIEKWYGTHANFITYGGVEINKKKIFLTNKRFKKIKILLVGRLEKDNGAEVYLKALKKLEEQKVHFEFNALGDGTYARKFTKFGKVIGFQKDVYPSLRKADVVFASSYLSILEALALGKRVFSVYQNDLKKDYLILSPFRKYINITGSAEELVDLIDTINVRKQNEAQAWANTQTWENVLDMYYKLWQK